jgi:hypothetical protein
MRSPRSRTYSCFMANVTDEDRSGTMFYGGYDHQVGKERAVEMRREVEQNRLETRLAKGALVYGEDVPRRGIAARGGAVVVALFR